MLVIDAHLDIAWNALQWNRNLLNSVYTIRTQESSVPGKGRAQNTVAFPEMRKGRIALCFATLLARSTGVPVPHLDYSTPCQAYGITRGQLAYYRALEKTGHVRVIANVSELDRHIAEWESFDKPAPTGNEITPPLGFIISMESADSIIRPDELPEWWEAGLRILGISHFGGGRYAGGTTVEDGLSKMGYELLCEIERLGIILDLSHLTDKAFWQALDRYDGPVLASHNNCRTLVPHQRQFSDEQIQAIIERDGVIGVAFDCWMLQAGWISGESKNDGITMNTVVDHIDHICRLSGNSRHVGIGSDLDGGFGREESPYDLDTISDLQKLAGLLESRGYSEENVEGVMHGNWLRFLRQNWE